MKIVGEHRKSLMSSQGSGTCFNGGTRAKCDTGSGGNDAGNCRSDPRLLVTGYCQSRLIADVVSGRQKMGRAMTPPDCAFVIEHSQIAADGLNRNGQPFGQCSRGQRGVACQKAQDSIVAAGNISVLHFLTKPE